MKIAEDWNFEYLLICANDPAVQGQLLPNPQNIAFIKRVQADALKEGMRRAAKVLGRGCDNDYCKSGVCELLREKNVEILTTAEQLTEKAL